MNKSKYNISIIIPAYNCEKYIKRCIESIINQNCKSIEIIIINDGSTDTTLEKCRYYEKKYDNIILLDQDNKGVSYSRNIGIKRATGNYIMFVDADDYLLDNSLNKIEKLLTKQFDVIRFSYSIKDNKEKRNIIFDEKFYHLEKDNRKHFFNNFFEGNIENIVWGQLIKKYLIEDIVFDENLFYGEDVLFNYEVYRKAKNIFYTNILLYIYEQNSNSVTRNLSNIKILDKIYNLINVYERLILNNEFKENEKTLEKKAINEIMPQIMLLIFDNKMQKEQILNQYERVCNVELLKKIFRDITIEDLKDVKYKRVYKYMQTSNYYLLYRYLRVYKLLKKIQKILIRE